MDSSAKCMPSRLTAIFGCLLVGILLAGLVSWSAPYAYAQDDAAPPADGGAAPAPAGGAAPQGKTPNLLLHIIKSAGIVFGPLLLLVSLGLVAIIVLLAMDLRMPMAIPPGFVEEFTDTINKRKFKEAFEMTRQDTSFLGKVLTAGMSRLQYGIEDAREAAMNMVDSVKATKEQLITYLATIGTLGPMLGLVGTVFGMILAFMELAKGGTPRPDKLADGISHALVVTLLGIGLSVPAIFCHALFRNRLIRIAMDVSNISDDLLTQMYHNSKRQPGAAPSTPSANSQGAPVAAAKAGP